MCFDRIDRLQGMSSNRNEISCDLSLIVDGGNVGRKRNRIVGQLDAGAVQIKPLGPDDHHRVLSVRHAA